MTLIPQNPDTVVITLDEEESNEISIRISELSKTTELKIQKSKPKQDWVAHPPLSWYESRELKPPYWKIPESIGQLHHLKSLYLVNLDISELPNSFTQLQNLEFLDLSLNKLNLSNELPKINLKHLKVLGNHFDEVEIQQFKEEFPNVKIEYKSEKRKKTKLISILLFKQTLLSHKSSFRTDRNGIFYLSIKTEDSSNLHEITSGCLAPESI